MRLEFLGALYNEEHEIADLIGHVAPFVDRLNFCDDGSTDQTISIIREYQRMYPIQYKYIAHTGLPETVKNEALSLISDNSWVLMLDADERFAPGVLDEVKNWLDDGMNVSGISDEITHVYFNQIEILDGRAVRQFNKAKLFKKEVIHFPLNNIHADDSFDGDGIYKEGWTVFHRKTTAKQVQRETEYLSTYRKLLLDGHIDEGREKWLQGLHYFVHPKG